MKKRILAMLLAFVMLIGTLPVSAFATEAEEPEVILCETEGCEYSSGHEGNCSNYVAPTEACTTEGCTYGANHEGNCSNYVAPTACETEGCTYTYGHEGECSPVVDQAAAQPVIELIAAIGEVTLESEAAISAADTAYNALTDEQKLLVANLGVLEAAKATYTLLSAVPEPVAEGTLIYNYQDASMGGTKKWPAATAYVKTLTLSGVTIHSCTWNDAKDTCTVILAAGTAPDAAFTITRSVQGMVNTFFNDASNTANSFDTALSGGTATVTVKAVRMSTKVTKTFNFSISPSGGGTANTPPALREGVAASVDAAITLGDAYSLKLDEIFTDADGDILTYTVKVGDADPVAAETAYSYTPTEAGEQVLVFTANDGKEGTVTYTVNLTVAEPEVKTANVTVTVSTEGTIRLVNAPVTVKDLNGDALLSYDEALIATHDAHYPGGAAAGYASQEGSYGIQVGRLWGIGDGYFANALFYNNDTALDMNVGESYVAAGDRLYACSLKYSDSWGDAYTYFDKTGITVDADAEFPLTLNGSTYMGGALLFKELAVGTWNGGTFTPITGKSFDSNGKVTLSFDTAGTYIVSAEGEYYDDYGSLTPIIPPYCIVTVTEPEIVITGIRLDKTELTLVEGTSDTLTATLTPEDADGEITWTSSDETVVTVENGVVTALKAGTATITAKVDKLTAICTVTVKAEQEIPVGLSELKFTGGSSKTASVHTLIPAFDPKVTEYTLVVPDSSSSVFAWATAAEGMTDTIEVSYINTSNVEKTIKLTSGKTTGASLQSAVKTGTFTGNTLTVTAGDAVYTVKIQRQATLSKLTVALADGAAVTMDPAFKATAYSYSAKIPGSGAVTVAATPRTSAANIIVSGTAEDGTLTPQWSDNAYTVTVTVGGEGAVENTYTLSFLELPEAITITKAPDKTEYKMGECFDPAGMVVEAVYSSNNKVTQIPVADLVFEPSGALSNETGITINYDGICTILPITVTLPFDGSGTEADPFQIKTQQDLITLSDLVKAGVNFSGQYLRMENDIELPTDWTPIGVLINPGIGHNQGGANMHAFYGTFNGNGKTLTVPAGGLPLFGYVGPGATIQNLNIFGTQIAGYGLINNLEGVNLSGTVTISGVTLKSGSSTLKSGLTGTYLTAQNPYSGCSASFEVVIRNCTVESGVVVGYSKDQSNIGGIVGRLNGTVENCVSKATVYGVNNVGGLIGSADQGFRAATVSANQFGGSVVASGNYAGGIMGSGYSTGSTAPNGTHPNISSNTVTGNVTGADCVGGIYGGDPYIAQSWENSAYTMKNNTFTGTVHATGGTYVGGLAGYLKSLNKYTDISGNYYKSGCGADKGIGFVHYVDTNCATHETASGAVYFSTETSTADCPKVTGCAWKKAHNRTDDPLGDDAAKLCYTDTQTEPVAVELKISGSCKTTYVKGEKLDLSGIVLTVVYNDDSTKTVTLENVTVTGFDADKVGEQNLTITYNGLTASITVKVANPKSEIKVTVSVYGDSKHGENGSIHTLAGGGLTTWISATTYTVDSNATVWDVLKKCLDEKGFTYSNPTGNYISSVNGLAEFDNGTNSGWMYTLNGVHSENGVAQQYLKNGDVIVLHYSDDYTKEQGSEDYEDEDTKAAEKVEELIDAIGTVTLDSKDKIDAARKAYDNLTYAQKQEVGNYAKLTAAEAKYAELKKADDEKKADAVEALIDKIDTVITLDSEAEIASARKAYDALTADQKKLVDNYKKLTDAEYDLALRKADEKDKEAAEAVEKLIDEIGIVTLDSEEKIKLARDAYDKLTAIQKNIVKNYADLLKAEEKLAVLKELADVENAYTTTGNYLETLGTPVPGSVGGEWMVIGLLRSGRQLKDADSYYDAVVKFVQENIDENGRLHRAKSTENSRMILALTAMGKDVTDVGGHNLLTGLNDMEYVQKQGINGPIWALMALDCGNYPVPEGDVTREALIQVLLDAQLADDGWALTGTVSDPDITGMALQALAPYCKTNAEVKKAVDEAIAALSMMQASDGSFASIDGSSSESIAQVVAGLAALGIDADTDPRFIKNGISALDALCAFYVQGGGFKHIPDGKLDGMATEQSYYALTAYFRMLDGKTALYNMTDVIDMGGDVTHEEPVETLPTETEPVPTETVDTPAKEGRSFPWWLAIVIVVLAGAIVVLVIISKPKKGRHMK